MQRQGCFHAGLPLALFTLLLLAFPAHADPVLYKGHRATELLSFGGHAAWSILHSAQTPAPLGRAAAFPEDDNPFIDPNAPYDGTLSLADEGGEPGPWADDGRNVFVNDPCLDPPPPSRRRTVQSETELAVLNSRNSRGRKIVVGYNDSYGFYDNRQGLSGYSYSTDGGKSFIDASGLPPVVNDGSPAGTPGSDAYAGDPVVVVHNRSETFYFASIYLTPNGFQTLAVNRGHFENTPPQSIESRPNTRCKNNPRYNGVPLWPSDQQERIIWEPPVVAVSEAELGGGPKPDPQGPDALDKEWLYVDQRTGVLYLSYTRFGSDGSTPLELVRSYDGGKTWTAPSTIVPNLDDTFNQGSQPIVTSTGRVIVTWYSKTFLLSPPFPVISERIEEAFSDNDGNTFGPTITVAHVAAQGEPPGYNRGRREILNAPYIATDRFASNDDEGDGYYGDDFDGRRGAGNVYITYFTGTSPSFRTPASSGIILLSTSRDNGLTWGTPVKVNTDNTLTSHVFPSAQVNRRHQVFVGWLDRRLDPVNNVLTDTWAARSDDQGRSFHGNQRVTTVSTSWFQRADARPNFGDYNSSELLGFDTFVETWADGRFPTGSFIPPTCTPNPPPGQQCPPRLAGTPDTFFAIVPSSDNDGR